MLDRYRPELVDSTIYGVPSLVWPGATGHDYFAATKRGKAAVSLYTIIADRYPDDVATAPKSLQDKRSGRATYAFTAMDDELQQQLTDLLDRLLLRYRTEHGG
ncbi:hypothetical protein GCM10027446_15830 [Angustibacter peucedani]